MYFWFFWLFQILTEEITPTLTKLKEVRTINVFQQDSDRPQLKEKILEAEYMYLQVQITNFQNFCTVYPENNFKIIKIMNLHYDVQSFHCRFLYTLGKSLGLNGLHVYIFWHTWQIGAI